AGRPGRRRSWAVRRSAAGCGAGPTRACRAIRRCASGLRGWNSDRLRPERPPREPFPTAQTNPRKERPLRRRRHRRLHRRSPPISVATDRKEGLHRWQPFRPKKRRRTVTCPDSCLYPCFCPAWGSAIQCILECWIFSQPRIIALARSRVKLLGDISMSTARGFLAEFREFAVKGNMIDLAVGVIIGAAFGKIIDSLVKDVVMPIVSFILGGQVDFSNLFW